MHGDYSIYDSMYGEAMRRGWSGWGGDDRIAQGPEQISRIFAKPYVPRRGRALELGCGEGHLSRLLAKQGFAVTGVDVSGIAIDWARSKTVDADLDFRQVDCAMPGALGDEAFDLVVDGNCLHCIIGADRAVFFKNVLGVHSTQSVFFVSSLCSKIESDLLIERNAMPYRYVPTVNALLDELRQAHFQILDFEVRNRTDYDHVNVFARAQPVHNSLQPTAFGRG